MAHHTPMVTSIWVRHGFLRLSFVLIIYVPQGHALNKILKDIINRYHVSLGRRVQ